ncbi:MAG: PD40 domain-containing protein, partial [Proteobacteria bacterium]|nr:PD40 domain-containing protein [Pseudomonadota bacterium]
MENDAYKCRYKGNCLLSAVLLLTVGAVTAQTPLSPEQLIERSNISELEWSASGQRLALVVTEPVTDEGQLESIWLYDSEDDLLRRFTTAGEENRRPRWSPSGDRLAFLSTRGDGETQIYVMPMNGGEAQALTGEKSGVTAFEWSPDGDAIAYLSADPAPDDEEEKKKLKD